MALILSRAICNFGQWNVGYICTVALEPASLRAGLGTMQSENWYETKQERQTRMRSEKYVQPSHPPTKDSYLPKGQGKAKFQQVQAPGKLCASYSTWTLQPHKQNTLFGGGGQQHLRRQTRCPETKRFNSGAILQTPMTSLFSNFQPALQRPSWVPAYMGTNPQNTPRRRPFPVSLWLDRCK